MGDPPYIALVRVGPALVTAVLLIGAGTACANPTYDDTSAREKLVAAGLSDQQARCVTRGLDKKVGRRLVAHAKPTHEEREKTAAVLTACGVDVTRPSDRSS
jgi:hypothetical protein